MFWSYFDVVGDEDVVVIIIGVVVVVGVVVFVGVVRCYLLLLLLFLSSFV